MTTLDEAIGRARGILADAIAEHRPAAIFAAFSGGNDSIVSTHFTLAERPEAVPLHIDTGTGLRLTRKHVLGTAADRGWQLQVERTPESYEALVLGRSKGYPGGFPGRRMHGVMYNRLKERAIRRAVARAKEGHPRSARVLIVSGIRGDESDVRSGYKREVSRVGAQVWVNPFYWATAEHFAEYRERFGLPRNPVKDRLGVSGECNCGCFACPFERLQFKAIDPDFDAWLSDLERRVWEAGFPWGWDDQPPKWFLQRSQGQGFLFDMDPGPMCYGCGKGAGPDPDDLCGDCWQPYSDCRCPSNPVGV